MPLDPNLIRLTLLEFILSNTMLYLGSLEEEEAGACCCLDRFLASILQSRPQNTSPVLVMLPLMTSLPQTEQLLAVLRPERASALARAGSRVLILFLLRLDPDGERGG